MQSFFNQQLGIRLKKLRQEKGLSQRELAEISGVALSKIRTCERGGRLRGLENTVKLAKFFGISTDRFLGGEQI